MCYLPISHGSSLASAAAGELSHPSESGSAPSVWRAASTLMGQPLHKRTSKSSKKSNSVTAPDYRVHLAGAAWPRPGLLKWVSDACQFACATLRQARRRTKSIATRRAWSTTSRPPCGPAQVQWQPPQQGDSMRAALRHETHAFPWEI